jgi:1-acyl-sn-glycerol-3-phosphate acyltransferase
LSNPPIPLRVFASRQLFFNPFLGVQLRAGRHVPVGGSKQRGSIRSIRLGVRALAETGTGILIFPEVPHLDGKLHEFQEGAALLGIKTGVPIIPIALRGTRKYTGGIVEVRIGEPIQTASLRLSDREWLTRHMHDRVAELLRAGASVRICTDTLA